MGGTILMRHPRQWLLLLATLRIHLNRWSRGLLWHGLSDRIKVNRRKPWVSCTLLPTHKAGFQQPRHRHDVVWQFSIRDHITTKNNLSPCAGWHDCVSVSILVYPENRWGPPYDDTDDDFRLISRVASGKLHVLYIRKVAWIIYARQLFLPL